MRLKNAVGIALAALAFAVSGPAASAAGQGGLPDLKVGAIVSGPNIPFFNKVFGPADLAVVRPQNLYMLKELGGGLKTVLVAITDLPHAPAILHQAKSLGASVIALNLEANPQIQVGQDILGKALNFARAVKKAGFGLVVVPRPTDKGLNLQPWLNVVDGIIIPTQGAQSKEDYGQIVSAILTRIKTASPGLKVWAQVSVNPPNAPDMTAETILRKIAEISRFADGVFVVYAPKNWEKAKTILLKLKNLPAPSE